MCPFDLLFLLIFYSLQSVYTLNKKPVSLAVLELFCELVFHSLIVLPIGNVHTKFEVCSCSHYINIDEIPKFKSKPR